MSGGAFLVRQSAVIAAQAGQTVFEADQLKTNADGFIGLTLKDDTLLSLGPNSDVHLDHFIFSPGEGRLGFALRIARGLVAYVSGRIAKLSPDVGPARDPVGYRRRERHTPRDSRHSLKHDESRVVRIRRARTCCRPHVAAACGPRRVATPAEPAQTLAVLLPDTEPGAHSRAAVSNTAGNVELSHERDATRVATNQPPTPPARDEGRGDSAGVRADAGAPARSRCSISICTSGSSRTSSPRRRARFCRPC